MYDIKHIDSKQHEKLTGVPNETILTNVQKISDANVKLIIRIPLIPNYNSDEANINGIGDYIKSLNIDEVHLLPYHRIGKEKYKFTDDIYELGDMPDMATTEEGRILIKRSKLILELYGLKVFVGG